MEKLNGFLSSFAEACSPSKSSFSFAMDVIVVRRLDGTFASTPFYVKFGRFKLPNSSNIFLHLFINGSKCPTEMTLSRSGRAYFLRSVEFCEPLSPELNDSESSNEEPSGSEENESLIFEEEVKNPSRHSVRSYSSNTVPIKPSINLSSSELEKLGLVPGTNRVEYVTTTKKKVFLEGRIFLWHETEKIVISDIDGTLTKSDMMGHLCYMIGKDWSRGGAAECYAGVVERKYRMLYLTSRSVNQIKSTMGLLTTMQQKGLSLPEGPLILSHCGMFKSLIREISNYSKSYKEASLLGILELYPLDCLPFWAGLGNRVGDAIAYLRAGVDQNRIFIFSKSRKEKSFKKITQFQDLISNFDEYFPIYFT